MRYDVVLVGFRLNASMKPAQALQSVLGLPAPMCKDLTQHFPAHVLSGVSHSRAERVADELTSLGAKVEVRESRLSHASEPAGSLAASPSRAPFPVDELSGNYEIGEILAPMKRGSLAPLSPASSPPSPKRPSREELEEALRESLTPAPVSRGNATSSPPELLGNATPSSPEILGNFTPEPIEYNAAFAGLSNFEESLDGLDKAAPALHVDEAVMRSIRRAPETESMRAARRGAPLARFRRWLSQLMGPLLAWVGSLFWLTVICIITLLAVGYALEPSDVLGPFRTSALKNELPTLP